ncbi:MAG: hypothetical protein NWE76_04315, partial [Candidatus Bathyarchaeota archaeon]|nr:hypothetical protein [Candidatus Bathyarchaeota archaeon]
SGFFHEVTGLSRHLSQRINAERGLRAVREDAGLVDIANSISKAFGGKGQYTIKDLREATSDLMTFQYFSKLIAVPVRFPLLNSSQTLMTLWPTVKTKNFLRAWTMAFDEDAWLAAHREGVLKLDSGLRREILEYAASGKLGEHGWIKALDRFPSYVENVNRLVSYHAGRLEALDAGFKPNPVVRGFQWVKKRAGETDDEALLRNADRYGRLLSDVTQFSYGIESKPLALVGSTPRRLISQFKTFPIAYVTLLKDAARYDRPTLMKMVTALGILGGAPAMFGWLPFYQLTRDALAKQGLIIPDHTGLGAIAAGIGLADPMETGFAQAMREAAHLVDISISTDPFNLPQFTDRDKLNAYGRFGRFLIGPTFDMFLSTGVSTAQFALGGMPKEQYAKEAARTVSPFLGGAVEVGAEIAQGGVYTAAEQPRLIGQRDVFQLMSRLLGLQPSLRGQRYSVKHELKLAIQANDSARFESILRRARTLGVIISTKDIQDIRAQITREERGGSF